MEEKNISKTDKSLIVLADKHSKYVNQLKKSLIIGQLGFLKAGEMLQKIKDEKTFEAEDSAHKWSWEDFLSRADLPIPGSTFESQKRIAQMLMNIHRLFILNLGKDEEELAPLGYPKLNLISVPIKKSREEDRDNVVEEWLEKAKNLTYKDLYAEIKSGNAPIGTGLDCEHKFEELEWHCPDCGAWNKEPMNERHAGTTINSNTKK